MDLDLIGRGEQPTILGDGRQSRDFTYIDNTVEANLLAMKAPASQAAGQVFNVATGTRVDLNETFQLLKKIIGFTGDVKYTIDSPVEAHATLFPKYTDDDIHNLMAYLQTLK